MKKLIIFCFLSLGVSFNLLAQSTSEHKIWLGVNSNLGIGSNGQYSVTPRLALQVDKRTLVGVEGRFGKIEAPFWGIGMFGRYYVGNSRIVFFPHLALNYETYQKQKISKAGSLVARPGLGLRLGRLENRFGIELLVEKPLSISSQVSDLGNLKNQVGISLGIQYKF